jgi:hypothetical protein
MHQFSVQRTTGRYVLATGDAAAYRLRILHQVYGAGTHEILLDAGIRPACASPTSAAASAW